MIRECTCGALFTHEYELANCYLCGISMEFATPPRPARGLHGRFMYRNHKEERRSTPPGPRPAGVAMRRRKHRVAQLRAEGAL